MMNLCSSSIGLGESIKTDFKYEAVKLRFTLKAKASGTMPSYSGSVWRGMLGRELYRLSCLNKQAKTCEGCNFKNGCAYGATYEPTSTEFAPDLAVKMKYLPPPFVLESPYFQNGKWEKGDSIVISIMIYSYGVHYLHYMLEAFFAISQSGVGKNRIPFDIVSLELDRYQEESKELLVNNELEYEWITPEQINFTKAPNTKAVQIILDTPLRLQKSGEIVTELDKETFFVNCYRRAAILYEVNNLTLPYTEEELMNYVESISIVKPNVYTSSWSRYSGKTKKVIDLGGLKGTFQLKGDLEPVLSILEFASYFHIGKQTVFGLGKFSMWCRL